ncbi:MAG: hypothetical protein J6X79_05225 [Bacteroidales bacterium]|nr:hypothetical protein [Bacteroidales bacterium]
MKHIDSIIALLGAAILFAACGKDNSTLIIGNWANTAQSYEITVAGQANIPAGTISMEFTADSVMIADMRCNCIPKWEHYILTTENGKQILHVENGIHGDYVVDKLTADKLVLTSPDPNIDMDFMYTMERLR